MTSRASQNDTAVSWTEADERLMGLALDEARRCLSWGDVPIGAVVARGDEVLAAAGNERERRGDPTAHAEVLALRAASEVAGSGRGMRESTSVSSTVMAGIGSTPGH